MTGDRHPEWKGINYVESTKGNWVQVTGDGSSYGFVDIGLEVASGYGSIPLSKTTPSTTQSISLAIYHRRHFDFRYLRQSFHPKPRHFLLNYPKQLILLRD